MNFRKSSLSSRRRSPRDRAAWPQPLPSQSNTVLLVNHECIQCCVQPSSKVTFLINCCLNMCCFLKKKSKAKALKQQSLHGRPGSAPRSRPVCPVGVDRRGLKVQGARPSRPHRDHWRSAGPLTSRPCSPLPPRPQTPRPPSVVCEARPNRSRLPAPARSIRPRAARHAVSVRHVLAKPASCTARAGACL